MTDKESMKAYHIATAKERMNKSSVELDAVLVAAENMDWMQVVLNQGPPCFHLEKNGYFCGRAKRWDGHECMHPFVSLADLIRNVRGLQVGQER
jgi:hypothetical protein